MIDPDVPKLRKALTHLQKLVQEGLASPKEASMALGQMAETLVAERVKSTPMRFAVTHKGEVDSWLPTYDRGVPRGR